MDWHGLKLWLETTSGLNMDALHVHAGMLLQIATAAILRRPLKSVWPWLAVAIAVIVNEAYDLHYEIWPNRGDQYFESFKDAWNTLLLPTLFLLLARYAPALLVGGGRHGRR